MISGHSFHKVWSFRWACLYILGPFLRERIVAGDSSWVQAIATGNSRIASPAYSTLIPPPLHLRGPPPERHSHYSRTEAVVRISAVYHVPKSLGSRMGLNATSTQAGDRINQYYPLEKQHSSSQRLFWICSDRIVIYRQLMYEEVEIVLQVVESSQDFSVWTMRV